MNAVILLTLTLLLVAGVVSAAEQRVDLFAPDGTRQGYAIVDGRTGRVDYYDTQSRRVGFGHVEPSGRIGRLRMDGQRETDSALPSLPDPAPRLLR